MNTIDDAFIKDVESKYFRTNTDTGANDNALFIWNRVRNHVGLKNLVKTDLPAWCVTHKKYHVIQKDYGCQRQFTDLI